ncbi:hypothetical protein [Ammoniphilus sp. 3BR4]|uniref:hypothetical protein n=1 Tax=Ammoniphilus sp. 3BR4 TaxID=3158265 RepID=UPI003467A134
MWRAYVSLLILILLLPLSAEARGSGRDEVTFIVKSSPYASFESRLHIQNKTLVREILKGKEIPVERGPELPYAFLEVKKGKEAKVFMVSYSYNLFELKEGKKIWLSPETKAKIRFYIAMLRKHHFGQSVTWQDAARLLPRKGYAEVIDVETGLRFTVQRRAGSQHADVQPISAEDTEIMKKIYNGKWSWKRRAILVRTEGKTLAASMHGMPHGGGAITWNNFPGHFCIHFKDSTTHRRDVPDPGHDLMISKASGTLHDRIVHGKPEELVSLFITAVNEQDESVIQLLLHQYEEQKVQQLLAELDDVEGMRIDSLGQQTDGTELLSKQVTAVVNLKRKLQKDQRKTMSFHVTRGSLLDRWKLELSSLAEQF